MQSLTPREKSRPWERVFIQVLVFCTPPHIPSRLNGPKNLAASSPLGSGWIWTRTLLGENDLLEILEEIRVLWMLVTPRTFSNVLLPHFVAFLGRSLPLDGSICEELGRPGHLLCKANILEQWLLAYTVILFDLRKSFNTRREKGVIVLFIKLVVFCSWPSHYDLKFVEVLFIGYTEFIGESINCENLGSQFQMNLKQVVFIIVKFSLFVSSYVCNNEVV